MTTISGLFIKYPSVTTTRELCTKLNPLLSRDESPGVIKCTKRLYTLIVKHLDSAVSKCYHDCISTLFSTLSCIAKGSNDPSSGFQKFITFGLSEKHILTWFETLIGLDVKREDASWGKLVDDVLFNITIILGHLPEEVQQEMVPLLPPMLKCICDSFLPCTANIEAARGSNILLEVCTVEYKSSLNKKDETKQLILSIGKSIQDAGNYELQVTIVECLYRMTTATERASLARIWFKNAPSSVLKRFTSIREDEFEVDCRVFLNELNTSTKERTVYSLSCKRMLLGTFELHCPDDESLNSFWVDFNTGSNSVTVFVDDPAQTDASTPPEDSVWEMVTIKQSAINHWALRVQGGDRVLSISLNEPAHTLLPNIPSSQSHIVTISFSSACDPTHPTSLVFGSPKQPQSTSGERSKGKYTKQSNAIKSIHINQKSNGMYSHAGIQEISPIEVPPDTPALGEQVNSQGSTTPTSKGHIPMATPATSTPKPRQLLKTSLTALPAATPTHRPHPHVTPSSSARGSRLPLTFVSSGDSKRDIRKASLAVNAVMLGGGKSRIIQTVEPKTNPKHAQTMREESPSVRRPNVVSNTGTKRIKQSATKPKLSVSAGGTKSAVTNEARLGKGTRQSTSKPQSGCTTETDRKGLSQLTNLRHLDSPGREDTNSPVLDYDMPSTALRDKLLSQEAAKETHPSSDLYDDLYKPLKHTSGTESHESSLSTLSDVTNRASTGRKQRIFNLSGASNAHTKKGKGRKPKSKTSKSSSATSSRDSTLVSDTEPFAIPDSYPPGSSHTVEKRKLDPKDGSKTKRKSKRLNVLSKNGSFNFDSEDELDDSWKPVGKTITHKTTAKNLKEKENNAPVTSGDTCRNKSMPLTSANALKSTRNTNRPATKKTTKSGISESSSLSSKAAQRAISLKAKKDRQRIIDDIYGDFTTPESAVSKPKTFSKQNRKRIIDEVYDFTTPDSDLPKAKVTKVSPLKRQAPVNKTHTLTKAKARSTPSTKARLSKARSSPQVKPKSRNVLPVVKQTKLQPVRSEDNLKQGASSVRKNVPKPSTKLPSLDCLSSRTNREHSEDSSFQKKTYLSYKTTKLPSKKRTVADNSDFDDLLLHRPQSKKHCPPRDRQCPSPTQPKKHCPPRDRQCPSPTQPKKHCPPRDRQCPSPTQSPDKSNSFEEPSYSSTTDTPCSGYELPSTDETNKDKGIDTQTTEKANVPPHDSPNKRQITPSSITSSPSLSLHSSQITADLNVTAGFEQICRTLISKSWPPKIPPTSHQAKGFVESEVDESETENVSLGAGETSGFVEDNYETTSLTQLTRDIVNSHAQSTRNCTTKRAHTKATPKVIKATPRAPPRRNGKSKAANSDGKHCPKLKSVTPQPNTPLEDLHSDSGSESSHKSESVSTLSPTTQPITADHHDTMSTTSTASEADSEHHHITSDVRDLVTIFGTKTSKRKKVQQTKDKANSGELLRLWNAQQKERKDTLVVYRDQLHKELEVLERDVQTTQDTEKQASDLLRKQLKTLKQTLGSQQKQVDRLRTLQVSFHKHLGSIEESQSKEQLGATRSLKQEVHSIQKKLLGDYERQEVTRIKQCLHAMLLQV